MQVSIPSKQKPHESSESQAERIKQVELDVVSAWLEWKPVHTPFVDKIGYSW